MKYSDVLEKVGDKVSTAAGNSKMKREEIRPDTLISDLGMDSIDVTQLIMDLETEFTITIGNDELPSDKPLTVQAIACFVCTKKGVPIEAPASVEAPTPA